MKAIIPMEEKPLPGRVKPKGDTEFKTMRPVKFDQGRALLYLAATYPKITKVVREWVQNSIDAGATKVKVAVDLKARTVTVADNGEGTSEEKFSTALTQVCRTMKANLKDKFGRYGLGLIAGLGKCVKYTLTACVEGNESTGYRRWTFVSDDIAGMNEQVHVPEESANEFMFAPVELDEIHARLAQKAHKNPVWWRARMHMTGLTKDRTVSKFDPKEFAELIIGEFGQVMLKNAVVVSLRYTDEDGKSEGDRDIVATAYHGMKLQSFERKGNVVGTVSFKLYLAPKGAEGRKGKVYFSIKGNPFRLTSGDFLSSVGEILNADVARALSAKNGVFEGDIIAEGVTLHPDRKHFIENDALVEMCAAIEEWYDAVGHGVVDEIKEEKRDAVYQVVGLLVMKQFQDILETYMPDIYNRFKIGSVGPGHKRPKSVVDEIETTEISTDGGSLQPRDRTPPTGDPVPRIPTVPKTEKTTHKPHTVKGPKGPKRKVVKGGSVGITFAFEEMPVPRQVFDFDSKSGRLSFNTTNPGFGMCEEKGQVVLAKYLFTVAQVAVVLSQYEGQPEYEAQTVAMDDYLHLAVPGILNESGMLRAFRTLKEESSSE